MSKAPHGSWHGSPLEIFQLVPALYSWTANISEGSSIAELAEVSGQRRRRLLQGWGGREGVRPQPVLSLHPVFKRGSFVSLQPMDISGRGERRDSADGLVDALRPLVLQRDFPPVEVRT